MKSQTLAAACLAATIFLSAMPIYADEHGHKPEKLGHHAMSEGVSEGVKVTDAWARATPGRARNGGAYLTIVNEGRRDDRVMAVKSDVANRVEIHTHLNDGGIMRMRKVDGVDVPSGGSVTFKPGGYHLMFIGLKTPFKKGETFPVTLEFEKSGQRAVTVTVMGVGAMNSGMMHSHGAGHGTGHGK